MPIKFPLCPKWKPLLVASSAIWLSIPALTSLSDNPAHLDVAWAQDDDDSGDDDGGDDDDNSGASAGSDDRSGSSQQRERPRQQRRAEVRRAPAPPPPSLPDFARDELVVSDLDDADLALLLAEGFTIIERQPLSSLADTLTRLAIPANLTLELSRARVRQLPSGLDADFNHFYRTDEAGTTAHTSCSHENCAAFDLVGWPHDREGMTTCRATLPIGVIDTGVNAGHEILSRADLEVLRLPEISADPSTAIHGTAVVSLLAGSKDSRVPGLVPEAPVVAVDVFSRTGGDERTDAALLIKGLDLLAARDIRIINLSLSGPPNTVLARTIDSLTRADGLDAVIIAAAGNEGPLAAPAYPSAHPAVIAVTAVDGRGRVYPKAQRGPHIDLAAPGVNLLAATSIRGAKSKTGTSFATPFVTAAVALYLSQNPDASAQLVVEAMRNASGDLGALGPDDVFGTGLLNASGLCAAVITPVHAVPAVE